MAHRHLASFSHYSAQWSLQHSVHTFFPYVCHRRNVPDDLLIAPQYRGGFVAPLPSTNHLGAAGIVLKNRDTWPRTSKVYCHRAADWPADAEVILRLPVRRCTRRGAAIDLVLDRARENRSQFVITRARGREMIFWQSPKTAKQARPGVHIPTSRAHGQVLEILIDSGEKYPYRFSGQHARTVRERLACGRTTRSACRQHRGRCRAQDGQRLDLVDDQRADEVSMGAGRGPRAAVVVEEGYSKIFNTPI